MSFFVHPNALCETNSIGDGNKMWAFAHVLPGAKIGADCNICDGVFIEGDVIVGDRVTIKCGVQLWNGVRLADDVFVGPNATLTNDNFPRSKRYPEKLLETIVHSGASIGANATILPGITIGSGAMIGAGARYRPMPSWWATRQESPDTLPTSLTILISKALARKTATLPILLLKV